jgi:hypothetical protein
LSATQAEEVRRLRDIFVPCVGDDAERIERVLGGDAVVDDGRNGQAERDRDLGGDLDECAGERLLLGPGDVGDVEGRRRKEEVGEEDGERQRRERPLPVRILRVDDGKQQSRELRTMRRKARRDSSA